MAFEKLIVLFACLVVVTGKQEFDIGRYIIGNWQFEQNVTNMKTMETVESYSGKFGLIEKEGVLQGVLEVNQTDQDEFSTNRWKIRLETKSSNEAVLYKVEREKVDEFDLEDDFKKIFEIKLEEITAGMQHAQGWILSTSDWFELTLVTAERFLLRFYSPTKNTFTSFVGIRYKHIEEPTFFQQYGPTAIVIVVFAANLFLKAKMKSGQQRRYEEQIQSRETETETTDHSKQE